MGKRKPGAPTISAALPLSHVPKRGTDRPACCNLCGKPPDDLPLSLWRECDERDQPIAGELALVFIGQCCIKRMEDHPRLYVEERGEPGHFPKLCGSCKYRRHFDCTHPKLKKNGGPGLVVQLSNGLPPNMILCGRGGRIQPLKRAYECEGQS